MATNTKKRKIIPRGKQVLILVDPEEARESSHGILIPDEVEQERKSQGTIEAVGPDIKDVKVGDRVIYGTFAGENIKLRDGAEKVAYKIVEDTDVIAFIR